MKNTLKDLLIFTLLLLAYIYIINNIEYIKNQTIYILKISINNIIPILFPTLILSNIIFSSNIPYLINKYLKINPIYILSIISGSPTNAYILKNNNQDITKHLSLTNYPSLIFIYNYLLLIFNKRIAIILILLNISSNIIIYFIIKPSKLNQPNINKISLIQLITSSISSASTTIISIISTCIFYAILPTSLINNNYLKSLLLSITEITSSLNNISIINIPLNIKLLFTIISISTTGLCIQTQILNITNNINIKEYIKNRLLHLAIYLSLTYIIIHLLI